MKNIVYTMVLCAVVFSIMSAQARPPQVINLTSYQTNGGVVLFCTTPTPLSGTLTNLDVRYSLNPINNLNWTTASNVAGLTYPGNPGDVNEYLIDGLIPGINYYFAVKVGDDSGTGANSWSLPAMTYSLAGVDTCSAILTWCQSLCETAAGYKIYFGTSTGNYTSNFDVGNVTSCLVNNLAFGTKYYFAAMTYDTNGNISSFSNEATFQYPPAPP